MKSFKRRLREFFFPPPTAKLGIRLLPYLTMGVLTVGVLIGAAYAWDYSNSPSFCGTVCHTMPPDYTSYLVSPHARVACVDCHLGRDFIANRITRKAGDITHLFSLAFKKYEFPLQATDLRPARETCERCHYPAKFSDDSLREIVNYGNDPSNSPLTTYLTLKTGGGSKRVGLGRGIHWHIENQVYFLALDPQQQSIPYVRVIEDDGTITEYVELGSGLDPSTIDASKLQLMDCISCHNRITHLIFQPAETVDQLLRIGLISRTIPGIRVKSLEMFDDPTRPIELALNRIAGLDGYYSTYYADFYAANQPLVAQAIAALQEAYQQSVYPEQNTDWTSHPDNAGHKDSPGCFRCHDGKHLNAANEAVRLECNVCHSIPVVASAQDFVARIEISRGPEPESHFNTNWIAMHRDVFDPTCTNCHTIDDPGGVSNQSFCSNSACHGVSWEYAGFDAPELRQIILQQLPQPTPAATAGPLTYAATIGPLLEQHCGSCHGENGMLDLDLTTYESTMEGGQNGPVIIPGDPSASLLITKLTGERTHFAQLSDEEMRNLIDWILAGAPGQ